MDIALSPRKNGPFIDSQTERANLYGSLLGVDGPLRSKVVRNVTEKSRVLRGAARTELPTESIF